MFRSLQQHSDVLPKLFTPNVLMLDGKGNVMFESHLAEEYAKELIKAEDEKERKELERKEKERKRSLIGRLFG
jgi:hypothetical protein